MFAAPFQKRLVGSALLSLLLLSLGCVEEGSLAEEPGEAYSEALQISDHFHPQDEPNLASDYSEPIAPVFLLDLPSNHAARALFEDGVAHLESSDPFQQVSWMMDAGDISDLQFKSLGADGRWSQWAPVEITFEEGQMKNALIRLEEPVLELKMRGGEEIHSAQMEFYDQVIARQTFLANPSAPAQESVEENLRTTHQAVAPSNLVISRSQWGAANPNKICGNVVAPYRIAIHHTYRPADDGGDPAARMRAMQSYHMNNLGWCDIGYHFVVSQSGHIYQGRSRSNRPGAHVGGQNSGNVGISFIADFTAQTPTNTQLDAGARIMRWVRDEHGVALNRNTVKGHREHSGQSTACPGGLINHLSDLIDRANGSAETSPAPAPPPSSSDSSSPEPSSSNTSSSPDSGSGSGGGSSTSGYSVHPGGCSAAGGGSAPLATLLFAALGLVFLRRRQG